MRSRTAEELNGPSLLSEDRDDRRTSFSRCHIGDLPDIDGINRDGAPYQYCPWIQTEHAQRNGILRKIKVKSSHLKDFLPLTYLQDRLLRT